MTLDYEDPKLLLFYQVCSLCPGGSYREHTLGLSDSSGSLSSFCIIIVILFFIIGTRKGLHSLVKTVLT